MENNKGLLWAAGALVVLAAVVIFQLFGNDDSPEVDQQPASPPAATATLSPDTPTSTDPEEPDGTTEPTAKPTPGEADARALAEDAIKAYTEYSYTDQRWDTWMTRLAPMITPGLMHSLEDSLGSQQENQSYWKAQVTSRSEETRTEVTDVVVGGFDKSTAKKITYTVTFRTAIKSVDTNNEWTEPTENMTMWVTVVRKNGDWVVSDIRPTSDRSR